VECMQDGQLMGGLYGVCLNQVFFGESMFSLVSNTSKTALAGLVHLCLENKIKMIDCQMTTAHLLKLGAKEISRPHLQTLLQQWTAPVNPNPEKTDTQWHGQLVTSEISFRV